MGNDKERQKIAILFPGIGYTCDKPLLYYSAKMASAKGYEVKPLPYEGFPPKVKGDRKKMDESFDIALTQARAMLEGTDWEAYEEILMIGKSVGTIVLGAYANELGLKTRNILFTPLADTFRFPLGEAIAFHGTKDPWAQTEQIQRSCEGAGIPLELFEGANHSLETGELERDLTYLARALKSTRQFLS